MSEIIKIDVTGLDKLQKKLDKFGNEIQAEMSEAGKAAANEILNTEGLRAYPPATEANTPPTPYYIRGRGTQTKKGNKFNSERYGTLFTIKPFGKLGTLIGNRASYAPFLGGARQARAMAAKGWRKLSDVATEKIPAITKIFQKRIDYLIKKLGL